MNRVQRVQRVGQVEQADRVGRVALVAMLLAIATPALAQTRPPVLLDIEPYGLQRGTTATFTVNGANLMGADRVLFDDVGLSATIGAISDEGADIRKKVPGETGAVIQDKAEKNRLQITVTAAASVPTGRHGFRLHTPLGTTSFMSFWVGEEAEVSERPPNDAADKAMPLTAPVTVNGSLPKEGDVDYYRVDARAGRDLVVRVLATPLGSMTDPTVSLLSPDGRELASNDDFNGMRDSLVVFRPEADGPVIVRVADANAGGGWRHIYRVTIGELPVITSVFPLGRPKGSSSSVRVDGANLGGHTAGALGTPLPDQPMAAPVRVTGGHLLMDDPAAGRHPLDVAGAEQAAIAEAVAMLDGAGENIGDRLDAAVRMPRKAADIFGRIVVAEIVHHQERIGHRRISEAEDAMQLHAGAFHGRRCGTHMLYGTDRHGILSKVQLGQNIVIGSVRAKPAEPGTHCSQKKMRHCAM